jgi:hypothetical protein
MVRHQFCGGDSVPTTERRALAAPAGELSVRDHRMVLSISSLVLELTINFDVQCAQLHQ